MSSRLSPLTSRGRAAAVLVAGLLAAAILAPQAAEPAAAQGAACPNAEFRTGFSAHLPDCRAYELVTAQGSPPAPQGQHASADGEHFANVSYVISPDVSSFGNQFLSARKPVGWSTEGLIPPLSVTNVNICLPVITLWSEDFSRGLLRIGRYNDVAGGGCPVADPPLVEDAPQTYQNLFVRDFADESYELVNVTPDGVDPHPAFLQAGAEDLSHVAFDSQAKLTPDAPEGENLFLWSEGTVRLATILPDGTAAQDPDPPTSSTDVIVNGTIGNEQAQDFGGRRTGGATYTHALSEDGTRIVFQAEGSLYVRENPARPQSPLDGSGACTDPQLACTVQLDASGGGGSGGGGEFEWASADTSEIFFRAPASSGLTADTQPGSGQNLYRYEVESGSDMLTNLTASAEADVRGVSGASDDGSHVYFVADGALAPGATAGQPNLFLDHAGQTTFVATLSGSPAGTRIDEDCNWTAGCLISRVTSDGHFIAFTSIEPLTGYDNVPDDPQACDNHGAQEPSGDPCQQIFLYDAGAEELSCVSCDPSGDPPLGHAAISSPTGPPNLNELSLRHPPRNLSEGGRVFFESPDALVPADVNGEQGTDQILRDLVSSQDVYEYDDGRLRLLSSGSSPHPSLFMDASESGDDAFIATQQALLARDTDNLLSVYDARAGGGFAQPPAPEAPCQGDACQGGGQSPPPAPAPSSAGFVGPPNPTEDTTSRRCTRLDTKADKAKRKAKKAKRGFKQAKRKARGATGKRAKRLARKAKRATGKRAKRLERKARRATGKRAKRLARKADKRKSRFKAKRRKARKANRNVRRCKRGAGS